uniref:N-terminal domain of CBF1 interacting co-repressor CIR n=1 Tax=CrAss-like virus sp. ctYsL76 TaxID=2826826 RepID=A0A8S5QM93_9CAUD|nr:MAG TPA: N-terminal domain of CBF1 interacting co-repressor CIR [CrAss-like virus sp. ctYsL76]
MRLDRIYVMPELDDSFHPLTYDSIELYVA